VLILFASDQEITHENWSTKLSILSENLSIQLDKIQPSIIPNTTTPYVAVVFGTNPTKKDGAGSLGNDLVEFLKSIGHKVYTVDRAAPSTDYPDYIQLNFTEDSTKSDQSSDIGRIFSDNPGMHIKIFLMFASHDPLHNYRATDKWIKCFENCPEMMTAFREGRVSINHASTDAVQPSSTPGIFYKLPTADVDPTSKKQYRIGYPVSKLYQLIMMLKFFLSKQSSPNQYQLDTVSDLSKRIIREIQKCTDPTGFMFDQPCLMEIDNISSELHCLLEDVSGFFVPDGWSVFLTEMHDSRFSKSPDIDERINGMCSWVMLRAKNLKSSNFACTSIMDGNEEIKVYAKRQRISSDISDDADAAAAN